MAKIRVHELAKELNIKSAVLVTRIKEFGIDVASHQSTLSDQEVETIKKRLSGDTGPSNASPGAATTGGVVLRRRKVVVEVPDDQSSDSDAARQKQVEVTTTEVVKDSGTATSAPKVMVRRRVTAKTGEDVETLKGAEAAAAIEAVEANISQVDQETAPEPQAEKPLEPVSSAPVTADASPEARKAVEVKPTEPAKTEEKPPVKKSKPEFASATVVRRATMEERLELQKEMQQQQQQSSNYGAQSVRQEDSRGTRITGMTYPGKGPEEAETDPDFARRNKKKASAAAEDEIETPRRKVSLKGKKQHFSTRDLLSSTDDEDDLEIDDSLGVAPIIPAAKLKTVYTPNSGASRRNLKRRKDLKQTQITMPRAAYRVVKMGAMITIADLAKQLSVKASELIKKLMTQGEMVTINSNIDFDTASLIVSDYGHEVKDISTDITDIIKTKPIAEYKAGEVTTRAPIVTIMGHVDHGKTSILDAIRQAKVAAGEAGGITQHIGAYTVDKDGKKIAFLDTPGHEAFSNMRARGAKLTDIVVLVVAADDGVMPQTIESIAHARSAEVPIIVAINKIDKPTANFDRIYSELAAHGVQSEEWGGENQFVKVSALQKIGLEDLLDAILLQAEVLDLKGVVNAPAEGRVVEAHLDKGRGPVCTAMVLNGTLRVGDYLVAGVEYGKVRAMYDHSGKMVNEAGPATPVQVVGLSGVSAAGDQVNVVEDEKTAKSAADWRREQAAKMVQKTSGANLDDLLSRISSAESLEVPFILKADTHGSIEAIADAILKLNDNKKNIKNKIVHKAVGGITGSDIALAATSGAIILAFNVRANKILEDDAERSGVLIKYFSIIYEMVDVVKSLMAGRLPPIQSENILGHAQVKQPISVPKLGTIAGSSVIDGKITRNSLLRLIRDDVVIYDGKIKSLRRFKDDVKEVASGYECGISIEGYNDVKEGDVIEAYVIEETPATLDM